MKKLNATIFGQKQNEQKIYSVKWERGRFILRIWSPSFVTPNDLLELQNKNSHALEEMDSLTEKERNSI